MRVLDAWLRRYPHLKIANLEEVRDGMEQDIEEYQRRIGDRQSALFAVKERLDKAGYAERVALANSSRLPVPYTEVDWEAVAAGQAAEPYLVVIDDAPKEAEWIYAKHAKPYGLNYGYGWDRESVGINYVIGYCQKVGYVAAYGKTRNPGVFELVWPLPADKYARCPEKT